MEKRKVKMNSPLAPSSPVAEVREVSDVTSIRNIALRQIERIRELKVDVKALRDQKKSLMENDPALKQAENNAEEHLQAIKEAKSKVKALPEHAQLDTKEKEIKSEINEISGTLSNHLIQYSNLTGSNILEDDDGNELKIKHKVSVTSGQLKLF